jgi:hypothetical protein
MHTYLGYDMHGERQAWKTSDKLTCAWGRYNTRDGIWGRHAWGTIRRAGRHTWEVLGKRKLICSGMGKEDWDVLGGGRGMHRIMRHAGLSVI